MRVGQKGMAGNWYGLCTHRGSTIQRTERCLCRSVFSLNAYDRNVLVRRAQSGLIGVPSQTRANERVWRKQLYRSMRAVKDSLGDSLVARRYDGGHAQGETIWLAFKEMSSGPCSKKDSRHIFFVSALKGKDKETPDCAARKDSLYIFRGYSVPQEFSVDSVSPFPSGCHAALKF